MSEPEYTIHKRISDTETWVYSTALMEVEVSIGEETDFLKLYRPFKLLRVIKDTTQDKIRDIYVNFRPELRPMRLSEDRCEWIEDKT
jgi:hypothetical protein